MTPLKIVFAFIFISFLSFPGYGQVSGKSDNTAANKALVKKIFEELINKKNLAVFDQSFTADVIDHSAFPDQLPGREGLKNAVKGLFDAYPDINVKIEEIIAEGDIVVTRDLWNATEKSSGKKKSGWVMHMIRIKDGMITEEWSKGWEWLQ